MTFPDYPVTGDPGARQENHQVTGPEVTGVNLQALAISHDQGRLGHQIHKAGQGL